MTNQERFKIHGDVDIVNARMAVREYARHLGFSLTDQSCVSMASSSLAYKLELGREGAGGGEILIEPYKNHQRSGIRVRCIKNKANDSDQNVINNMGNSRWLVDDIEIKPALENGLEVIVIKWNSTQREQS
jgi:hypothetical protein